MIEINYDYFEYQRVLWRMAVLLCKWLKTFRKNVSPSKTHKQQTSETVIHVEISESSMIRLWKSQISHCAIWRSQYVNSSESLRGVKWFLTDVSVLPIGYIFKGQSVQEEAWTLWPLKTEPIGSPAKSVLAWTAWPLNVRPLRSTETFI